MIIFQMNVQKFRENMSNYTRLEALKLDEEKSKIEKEIAEWKSVLDSEQNIGMDGPLVDNEGYPRNDIDVAKVRLARNRIICLSNDHKDIMKKLSEALISIHAGPQPTNEPPTTSESSSCLSSSTTSVSRWSNGVLSFQIIVFCLVCITRFP